MSGGSSIHSMTGFSSVEGDVAGTRMRVEIKSLNHRYLDLKIRLPRELSSAEMPLRQSVQASVSRGAVELKVERLANEGEEETAVQANVGLAKHYFDSLREIQKALNLKDEIRTVDIASFPEVISRGSSDFPAEEAWTRLEPLIQSAVRKLIEMRAHEGSNLKKVLLTALDEMESKIKALRARRVECEAAYKSKVTERISAVFQAHPVQETSVQSVLESRIAQELALLLDRTDIEEELIRFKGHLDHFRKILTVGGPVGRKLDFMLQELHREINTLGNKAQDLAIGDEVIQLKVRLEQLREQVMNLE
jgi:uncharacterized protein (TIGR00255 family)